MKRLASLAALAILSAAAAPLAAQQNSCTGNPCTIQNTASVSVVDVMRLTLDGYTTDLGTPTESDFVAGYRTAAGPTATVRSNRPYRVTVKAVPSSFSWTAPTINGGTLADPLKPASDLLWGTAAGTYGNDMSASALLLSGNGTSSTQQQIHYKTLYSFAKDVPGTYSIVIDFTLAAP